MTGIISAEDLADYIDVEGTDEICEARADNSLPAPSRRGRKRQRSSPTAMILDSIHSDARRLYWSSHKIDYSYVNPALRSKGGMVRRNLRTHPAKNIRHPAEGPVSLFTILSRQLRMLTTLPLAETSFTRPEIELLKSKGYSQEDVQLWSKCLLTGSSIPASAVFKNDHQRLPLFLLLLYLRRTRIRASALGTVMRHLTSRLQADPIDWSSLQLLVIRLLRHARLVWPEAITWIASLFCTEATRIYTQMEKKTTDSSRFVSSLTRFCNSILSLISLPVPKHPVLAGVHQEKAQFLVLQFMNDCNPALTVTKHGFRGVARNQLTHAKTAQEKQWAILKGPSWPPWKENRHSMDEGKGYMFGASRASRIFHRLYEGGYSGRQWEQVAEVYAGWDTDLSPTIQTRTCLPRISGKNKSKSRNASLWVARIGTTRSRREAWACFLAHEEADTEASSEAYLAMFEKLHFPETQSQESTDGQKQSGNANQIFGTDLLPGDMKEVLPDHKSPLHHVYLTEPVPSYSQLYVRMRLKNIQPKKRLLAFFLDTHPDFSTCLSLLEASQDQFGGGIRTLLHGTFLNNENASPAVPDYFLTSFIRFLCRFGVFTHPAPEKPTQSYLRDHKLLFKSERKYLAEYAYALLMYFRPAYRPPWTAYMQKVLYGHQRKKSAESQYTTMCALFEKLDNIDMDLDDDQFQLMCAVVRYTAQTAYKRQLEPEFALRVLSSAPALLRTTFHMLVGANVDSSWTRPPGSGMDLLPPHAPSPAALQAYTRALGMLRDYEGLYSFSSWLTTYHKEVTVRANAQHGGSQTLYRTLVALRAALEGRLDSKNAHDGAPQEIIELVKAQIQSVKSWQWPPKEHVDVYVGWQARSSGPDQVPVPDVRKDVRSTDRDTKVKLKDKG